MQALLELNDVTVAILNVFVNAAPGRAGADLVVVRAEAPVIENVLLQSAGGRFDGSGDFQHVGGKILLQVLFRSVPGSICADNDIGHESVLLGSGVGGRCICAP